jgi:hypothetical protein
MIATPLLTLGRFEPGHGMAPTPAEAVLARLLERLARLAGAAAHRAAQALAAWRGPITPRSWLPLGVLLLALVFLLGRAGGLFGAAIARTWPADVVIAFLAAGGPFLIWGVVVRRRRHEGVIGNRPREGAVGAHFRAGR